MPQEEDERNATFRYEMQSAQLYLASIESDCAELESSAEKSVMSSTSNKWLFFSNYLSEQPTLAKEGSQATLQAPRNNIVSMTKNAH